MACLPNLAAVDVRKAIAPRLVPSVRLRIQADVSVVRVQDEVQREPVLEIPIGEGFPGLVVQEEAEELDEVRVAGREEAEHPLNVCGGIIIVVSKWKMVSPTAAWQSALRLAPMLMGFVSWK
jgi:hypothetical protein